MPLFECSRNQYLMFVTILSLCKIWFESIWTWVHRMLSVILLLLLQLRHKKGWNHQTKISFIFFRAYFMQIGANFENQNAILYWNQYFHLLYFQPKSELVWALCLEIENYILEIIQQELQEIFSDSNNLILNIIKSNMIMFQYFYLLNFI